jgi:ubiquinone/menaquinone biosynthesis C-methylase UbiE
MSDKTLEQCIDPWLQHMRWRQDFAQWRERRINQEHYQKERLAMLQQLAGSLDGAALLDLGAGMGGFAVAAALRGARVVACEYNPAYCDIIRRRGERHGLRLPVVQAAGEHIPLPSQQFDLVVSWDVIEHVQSPTAMLAEMARVLRPGGHVLLTVINRWAWKDPHYHLLGINWLPMPLAEWIIARRGRSKDGSPFGDMQRLSDMHYFSYGAFVNLAKRYGFAVRDMREEQLRMGAMPSRRWSRRVVRGVLHRMGLERAAYRFHRQWAMGMFELGLTK